MDAREIRYFRFQKIQYVRYLDARDPWYSRLQT